MIYEDSYVAVARLGGWSINRFGERWHVGLKLIDLDLFNGGGVSAELTAVVGKLAEPQAPSLVGGPAQTLQIFQTPFIAVFCAIIFHLGD